MKKTLLFGVFVVLGIFLITTSASAGALCIKPPPESKTCTKKEWLKIAETPIAFQRCVVTKHPKGYTSVAWRFDGKKKLYLGVTVYGTSISWKKYKNTPGGKYLLGLIFAGKPEFCGDPVKFGTLEGTWKKFPPQ